MRAVCTICSCNYLHHARVLAESLDKTNPELKRYLLLVDRPDRAAVMKGLGWDIITIDHLRATGDIEQLLFRYTQLESNTALKPYFLETLFAAHHITEVIYVDPDTAFFDSLHSVWKLLENHEAVLTPHITRPFADNRWPTDLQINRAGTFNLGFIALRKSINTAHLLSWWQQKLWAQGYMALDEGLHVDQKWMDFAPSLLPSCAISRDPRLNIAYWNLHYRGQHLSFDGESLYYKSSPAIFFHFSGLPTKNIWRVSKHQNRFRAKHFKALLPLFRWYSNRLAANDANTYLKMHYSYDYFDNGVRILKRHRRLFRALGLAAKLYGDPFSTIEKSSFFQCTNENSSRHLRALTSPAFIQTLKYLLSAQGLIARTRLRLAHRYRAPARTIFSNEDTIDGVNIVGFFDAHFGIATAAQNTLAALTSAALPSRKFSLQLKEQHSGIIKRHIADDTSETYSLTLWHINAQELPFVARSLYPQLHQHSGRNIGVFYWEMEYFPLKWRRAFDYLDEVWTASSYCKNSLQQATHLPVQHLRFPISVKHIANARERFHFPEEAFIVLCSFDFCSQPQRKNPHAVIEVFRRTVSQYSNALLVIKSINHTADPNASKLIDQALKGLAAIHIKNQLASDDYEALLNTCDVYMSLHRSEGFGLNLAKAMLLAKPVIATNYSGNTDFMNYQNSFPVEYQLSELSKNYGPYQQGTLWAEPDFDHAAELLNFAYRNQKSAQERALKGKADIAQLYSPHSCGQQLKYLLSKTKSVEITSENIVANA